MTRWRASTGTGSVEVTSVLQVVAEMHVVGRPTHMLVGDAFALMEGNNSRETGVIIGVPAGHVVVRTDTGQTIHLRPRRSTDTPSGLPAPRGRTSSEWVVERMS